MEICGEKTDIVIRGDMDLIQDLGLDSVNIILLISKVEEKFGIQFEDVDLLAEHFYYFGTFCQTISEKLNR